MYEDRNRIGSSTDRGDRCAFFGFSIELTLLGDHNAAVVWVCRLYRERNTRKWKFFHGQNFVFAAGVV